jgi:hypothetical protein
MKTYPRNPDAMMAGVSNLTLKQRGAYNSLLDLLYARDGLVLAHDDAGNARSMSIDTRQWKNVKLQLMALGKLWVNAAGMFRTPRFDDTVAHVAKRSAIAVASAQLRWDLFEKSCDFNDPSMLRKKKKIYKSKVVPPSPEPADGAHALPTSWQPNSNHLIVGDQIGLTQSEVVEAAAQMRAWAWGNGRSRANWDYFFENWLRRRKPKGNGNGRPVEETKSVTAVGRKWQQAGLVPDLGPRPQLRPTTCHPDVRMLPQNRGK